MKFSKYQQDIMDFVQYGQGSGIIEAVAGSGKTTTIVEATKLIPSNASVLFLAFNKSIVTELQQRLPAHVRASTFHGQGMSAWMKHSKGRPEVSDKKTSRILAQLVAEDVLSQASADYHFKAVMKLVGLAKNNAIDPTALDAHIELAHLIEHFDIQSEDPRSLVDVTKQILQASIAASDNVIDFDDMLYMPHVANVEFWKNDFVFIDEAQDTNEIQLLMLEKLLKPTGRLIAVGDPYQAIYGFRGADSDAMNKIKERFDTQQFPLSVSYRCPQMVVAEAKKVVPHIEAFEDAPEGDVQEWRSDWLPADFEQTDVIICRNTAPLVNMCYKFIGAAIPAKILGRDLGKGLVRIVERARQATLQVTLHSIVMKRNNAAEKLIRLEEFTQLQNLDDKIKAIEVIAARVVTVDELIRVINDLFTDKPGHKAITLCTVHKSKGLEWNRVFILGRDSYMPSPYATKEWEKQQEINLEYVAITRAKETLCFISEQKR